MKPPSISLAALLSKANAHGFNVVGVADVRRASAVLSTHQSAVSKWQAKGYAGDMQYMKRSPALYTGFEHLVPDVRSVLSFLVPYIASAPSNEAPPSGYGCVARYARGSDYHTVVKKYLQALVADLKTVVSAPSSINARVFTDAVPLLERAVAQSVGLGFVGKNAMLIHPHIGSFHFIAEIVWNVVVDEMENSNHTISTKDSFETCGGCNACIRVCPSGALVEGFAVDARRCVSYLTIEKRGTLNSVEQLMLGHWLFGCDDCQNICPHNAGIDVQYIIPELEQCKVFPHLKLVDLMKISSHKEFEVRFNDTALMRGGRENLVRNACCVAANCSLLEAVPHLLHLAETDTSSVVRYHAIAALGRMESKLNGTEKRRVNGILAKLSIDADDEIP